jgi:hypothetical protein
MRDFATLAGLCLLSALSASVLILDSASKSSLLDS